MTTRSLFVLLLLALFAVSFYNTLGVEAIATPEEAKAYREARIAKQTESRKAAIAAAEEERKRFVVVGYLPEWRFEGTNYDLISQYLTHLILFSIEVTPEGELAALDRLPSPDAMARAQAAAKAHGTKLLICFGGNGRTNGFPQMAQNKKKRQNFMKNLAEFIDKYELDGVDYNWEYPNGKEQWQGLQALLFMTAHMFKQRGKGEIISMAYYPDGRQEKIIQALHLDKQVDLIHMMSYDAPGQHSTLNFGKKAVDQGVADIPKEVLTMGLPFYSRDVKTGDWKTYEDLLKTHSTPEKPLDPSTNIIDSAYFNGIEMLQQKVDYAREKGIKGVMIWEVGQDCLSGVCGVDGPFDTETTSLLVAVHNQVQATQPKEVDNGSKSEL